MERVSTYSSTHAVSQVNLLGRRAIFFFIDIQGHDGSCAQNGLGFRGPNHG